MCALGNSVSRVQCFILYLIDFLSYVAYYVKFLPSDSKKLRPSSSLNRNRCAINDTLSEMYNFHVHAVPRENDFDLRIVLSYSNLQNFQYR